MWSMVAQRLTLITTPAATPDQLWQRLEAAWSVVPLEHIQSLFESMPSKEVCTPSHDKNESYFSVDQQRGVLSTRVFFKSGESRSQSSYAGGGLSCPGRKFTPTDTCGAENS
ncbi:hypothetical protein TNCV_551101 [Trichonephila clavipes]|nr:hypothetical protein TNCV_551101 [Trichonephila clavipes]